MFCLVFARVSPVPREMPVCECFVISFIVLV